MFGQQQPFGTPTTQANAFGGFGQPTFGTTGGGLFGQQQQQPAQQQPLFGSTSTFGASTFGQPQQPQAQATSNPFGQTTTTFGASNPFSAQPQPAQSGGLFGSSTPFGSTAAQPATQPAFGQPQQQQQQTTGLFGSTTTGSSLFGQSKPGGFGATTTFGAQPTTTSLFGSQQPAQSTGGLFGSTSSGLFGSQPNANPFASSGPVGTTIKFSPLVGQDTAVKNGNQSSVTTKNYCISTMKEYDEKKSLEELRYEDYQAGRKYGTATAPAQSGGLFGQPAAQPTTGGLFGNTTSAFGQASSFGQTAAKPTGFGTGTSLFGNTSAQPATTGLFGQTTAPATGGFGANTGTTGLFGQPAQNTTTTSAFGTSFGTTTGFGTATQQTTQPLFGGMTTQSGQPSAFGSTSTFGTNTGFGQTSAFGTSAAPSTGLFGSQPAATTTASAFPAFGQSSLFSKPATTTAPAFGGFGTTTSTPATTGFAGFGSLGSTNSGTGGGLFGNTTSAFGATNTAKPTFGGFGQTTAAPATTSFFGTQPATNTQQTGSIFGQTGTTSGGLFGQQTNSSIFGSNPLQQPTSSQSSSGSVHAQIVELVRSGVSDTDVLCNMYSQLPVKEAQQKVQPLSRDTINAFISNAKRNYAPADGESRKDERLYSFYVAPTHSFDGLNLSSTSGPVSWRSAAAKRDERLKLDRAYIEKVESEVTSARSDGVSRVSTSSVPQIQSSVYSTASKAKAVSRTERGTAHPEKVTPPVQVSRNLREAFDEDSPQNTDNRQDSFLGRGRESNRSNGRDNRDVQIIDDDDSDRENIPIGGNAVLLTKTGYYTIPDVYELVLDEKGQCIVDGFLVGRLGCGSVKFLGLTNVAGMNLDKLVTINDKEVVVYPEENDKPPVGKGLNKKAVVTFENVWPMSSDMERVLSKQDIIDSGFEDVLRARVTAMGDADFLQYNVDSGQLSFSVNHFSRYKLVLTEEDTRILLNKRKMPLERSFGNVIDGNVDADQGDQIKQPPSTADDYVSPGKRRRSEKSSLVGIRGNSFTPKTRMSYANVSQDVEDYFERAMLDETDVDEPSKSQAELVLPQHIKRYRSISTEFGPGFKPFCAQLFSQPSGEQWVVVDGEGELSTIQDGNCQKEDLTSGSKWLLEEMMEFYLGNCSYKTENGHTRIFAPDSEGDFVSRFCELACKLTEGRAEFLQEKLGWDLLSRLYKSFQSAEANNCEGFYEWLMSAMSLLTPRLPMDQVTEENAAREVFLQMICGETEKATFIAREFGLHSIENAIIVFFDPQEEEFGDDEDDAGSPKDAVRSLLRDHVQAMTSNPDGLVDNDQICMVKLLMFLSGETKMGAEEDGGQGRMISVCEDLNWLQCLAVCAFNLRMSGRLPTDVMDIVQHYKDLATEDDFCCTLPSDDSPVPFFLYSMIQHYGRLSTHNMKTTLENDITTSSTLDVRVKWFMMRMYRMLHEGFSESSELLLTNEFANTLQTCGFPHIAITALMHLAQTRSSTNRIKELSLALSAMKNTNSEVYNLLTRFLAEDVNLSRKILKETEANLALKNGDYLEAMEQYYRAESYKLCKDLIRKYVLPVLASGDSKMYAEALGSVKKISGEGVKEMAPYGRFFELLSVIEDNQDCQYIPEYLAERLTDLLEYVQDNREALLVGFEENSVVTAMVKDKLKEGKALLYYGSDELSVPNLSP